MAHDPRNPPEGISEEVAERLAEEDPETLRAIAEFAGALAAREEAGDDGDPAARETPDTGQRRGDRAVEEDEPPGDWEEKDWAAAVEDVDAPSRATLTIKTINDNDYYYYQWREGDEVLSEYVAPVSPSR